MNTSPQIEYSYQGEARILTWHSENQNPPPKKVVPADDTMSADVAYKLVCEGTALLWQGDYHNARNLLQALSRRVDRKRSQREVKTTPKEIFHQHRQAQAQRARILGMLLIPVTADLTIPLRRAPDVANACKQALGTQKTDFAIALRELQGIIGAYEWRKKGVPVPALGSHISPHYGVFSPIRGEYIALIEKANLPETSLAFDIGTGTGIIAAILAHRGIKKIIATDLDQRAIACATDNINRLDLTNAVSVVQTDLFPDGEAPLIVCNPPWLPAKPSSALEHAVYDPGSKMLKAFLAGLPAHLTKNGQGWLILSDLAEHLALRSRQELLDWIDAAGLKVLSKADIHPHHNKASDQSDPLYAARVLEITSLWVLQKKSA